MLAQDCVKNDACQIHSIVRLHSPNTANFYKEPTRKTLEDTFEPLHSREGAQVTSKIEFVINSLRRYASLTWHESTIPACPEPSSMSNLYNLFPLPGI